MSEGKVTGVLPAAIVSFICAGAYIGTNASFLSEMTIYNELLALMTDAGSDGLAMAHGSMLYGIGGAALVIVASVLGIVSSVANLKPLAYIYILLCVVGSIGVLIPGFLIPTYTDAIYAVLEPHPNLADPEFTTDQKAISDVSVAIHNECCTQYYNPAETQGPVEDCADVASGDEGACPLPDLLTSIQNDEIEEILPKLCSCSTYGDTELIAGMRERDTCELLQDLKYPVGADLTIPTTDIKLQFVFQFTPYAGALDQFDAMTMVAPPTPPGINGTTGFGCGFGFVKAITWIHYLYVGYLTSTAIYAGYAVCGVNVLTCGLVLTYWAMGGSSGDDEWLNGDVVSPGAGGKSDPAAF